MVPLWLLLLTTGLAFGVVGVWLDNKDWESWGATGFATSYSSNTLAAANACQRAALVFLGLAAWAGLS